MRIELTDENANYVDQQLASGKYASAEEVVAHALRVMRNVEHAVTSADGELRRQIDFGLEDIAGGRVSDWDVEELKSFILSAAPRNADKKAS